MTPENLPPHIKIPGHALKSWLLSNAKKPPSSRYTRGEKVIRFIERYCRVPEGKFVGRPIELDFFQKLFILAVYDNPAGTSVAILSIARKNGKTALIAALALAHLVGPEARLNAQLVSGARSRDQASLVFKLALKMVNLNPELRSIIRDVPSSKQLLGLTMNTEYRALSAEGGSNHGLSPVLAIIDEMGQVRGDQDDFIEAIETAQGAYDDALEIIISTQAPTDGDMLSIRIDDAIRSADPHTVCHVYSADFYAAEHDCKPEEVNCLDEDAWLAANPALGKFRSRIELERWAQRASRMPSAENSFRNLYLNQRVNRIASFIPASIWAKGNRPVDDRAFLGDVWGGLDLAETTDLAAFVYGSQLRRLLHHLQNGGEMPEDISDWHIRALFWKPEATLEEHEKRDRVPYRRWADQGYIRTTPGVAIDYEFVAHDIAHELEGLNVKGIAYDRFRFKTLEKKFQDMDDPVSLPFVEWGQGYLSMAPAMDVTEIEFLNDRVVHGGDPVMRMCAANAVVIKDPAGNRKLDKSKSTGRIDGMQALTMMIGLASLAEEPEEENVYMKRGLVVL
jgi:phage terminase large subunit-like protein